MKGIRRGSLRLVLAGDVAEPPHATADVNALLCSSGTTSRSLEEVAEQLRPLIGADTAEVHQELLSSTGSAADADVRPDIQVAVARMRMRVPFGRKREIRKLPDHLWEGEQVQRLTVGYHGKGTGLVALTDRRLFFLQDGFLNRSTTDFPLSQIGSVSWKSGVSMGTLIVVFASGYKAEIKHMHKAEGKEMVDAVRVMARPGAAAGPSALDPGPAGWQQAEQVAASALQWMGFTDAAVTGNGRDGGLDVSGRKIAAQVKYTNAPVSRPVVQQLVGASRGRTTAFFSRAGYSTLAVEEADRNGMALFTLALPSSVRAHNRHARRMAPWLAREQRWPNRA